MTTLRVGSDSGVRSAVRLPRLMFGYFGLAVLFLAALWLGLWLHKSLRGIQNEALMLNEAWAHRQADYAEIGRLATRLDAPGNDVFETHDAVEARMQLEAALRPFGDAVQAARLDLEHELQPSAALEAPILVRVQQLRVHLDAISDAALAIGDEAQRIFSYFRTGQTDGAGVRLAAMNRAYATLADEVAGMGYTVREIQERHFRAGSALAERLGYIEYVTTAVTVCFLLAMIGYGAMISRRLRHDAAARDHALAEARESEARATAAAAHVRDSETRLRAVVDTAADGIITIDGGGRIESWNAAAARIFGYEAGDVLGRDVALLAAAPDTLRRDEALFRSLASGAARGAGIGREIEGRRKDGTRFPLDVAISEV
ncbi:MAG: PAS domain S-box protein, partial [bacterium]